MGPLLLLQVMGILRMNIDITEVMSVKQFPPRSHIRFPFKTQGLPTRKVAITINNDFIKKM